MSGMQLQGQPDEAYFCPDVLVTCDPDDHRAERLVRAPILVIEVISPSTASFDRGEKFAAYRRIRSLRAFVLVDPERRSFELFRRADNDVWELRDIAPDQPLKLTILDVEIPVRRIFRNLD